jgi:Peptidase family M28/PA domain
VFYLQRGDLNFCAREALHSWSLYGFHVAANITVVIASRISFTKSLLVLVLALGFTRSGVAAAAASNLPPVPTTVDSITPAELRMHLEFLSSSELGGRYTLSPSLAIAARYLASQLEAYGFRGTGPNGDFLQRFEVVSSKPDESKVSLELNLGGKLEKEKFGRDFFGAHDSAAGEAQGELVFVGGGISAPEQKRDDYAGKDVKGKIVVAVGGFPAGIDRSRLSDNQHGGGAAQVHGAAGMLVIPPQRFLNLIKDKDALERLSGRETVRLARETDGQLPALTLGPDLAEKVLSAFGLSLKTVYQAVNKNQPLTSKPAKCSARFSVTLQQTRTAAENVAGILEGTDPQLKDEYVTFSAHYDHLQTGPNGEIYHGADDDGSGTSAVLAIAKAMSLNRPRRSVLVMFHAGEELGLLGSEYNTDYAPVVPLDKIVVDLNIDMIGRSKPAGDKDPLDEHLTDANSVYLVGSNRISPELHEISEETNEEFQKLKLDYYYNDPANPERIYYRSDHWNYAKHGIPIIFYFSGTHVDYHRPTDTVDKIDFTKMTQITRLIFETGWRIANLDHHLLQN